MFVIYDLVFLFISLFFLPVYLFKRKFHRGFLSRLGFLPAGLELNRPIWIHAVSAGEAMAVRKLVPELRKLSAPAKKFVISTVTATGNKIAQGMIGEGDFLTYLPLDISFIVKKVINKIKPEIFIIAETEIWPNLINCLYKNNIPVVVINGRISDSSFKGYSLIKLLIKPVFRKVSFFCAQTERDAGRLRSLGVDPGKIKVTGNMKFDICEPPKVDYADYRLRELGLDSYARLLVCGSTHPNEEEIALGAYKRLLAEFPHLNLILAPRHPERTAQIENITARFGFNPVRLSQLKSPAAKQGSGRKVFILDIMGRLSFFYAISDIVFVGGSLVKKGGHNILEPAVLAKPILFGPHMFNFRDISGLFLGNKAALMVRNQEELEKGIRELLGNSKKAAELGERALKLIKDNQGASAETAFSIVKILIYHMSHNKS